MCSLEFPDIETQIWQPFQDDGVVVLGLAGGGLFGREDKTTVGAFEEQTGVTFPLLLGDRSYFEYANPDGRISPYPLDVVVDRNGIIRYLRHEFDGAAMEAVVAQLLAEG